MDNEQLVALVSWAGLLSQAVGGIMLLVLFLLLNISAGKRAYFRDWLVAWIALNVALFGAAFRFLLYPGLGIDFGLPSGIAIPASLFIYQAAKLGFWLFVVLGVHSCIGTLFAKRTRWLLCTGAVIYAALSVTVTDDYNGVIVWQAVFAVPLLSHAAWRLSMDFSRRESLGSRWTSVVLVTLAVTWLVYGVVQGPGRDLDLGLIGLVANHYNSIIDLLLQMLLAFGMVVIALEDGKRDVDAAHAELERAHEKLLSESRRDILTGALNRKAYMERTRLESVTGSHGVVALLDLDDFKSVNDRYGHPAGDRLLRHLVETLIHQLRAFDKVYRWGGDEFLIVMAGVSRKVASQRLEAIISGIPPVELEVAGQTRRLPVTVSFGAAEYSAGDDLEAVIQIADQRMYENKQERKAAADGIGNRPSGDDDPTDNV